MNNVTLKSELIKRLAFEHDTLTRIDERTYLTANLVDGPYTVADLRTWARAAFANSSTLSAILVYSTKDRMALMLRQSPQYGEDGETPCNLRMLNDSDYAMLPIETTSPDNQPVDDLGDFGSETAWQTTFLNRNVWEQAGWLTTMSGHSDSSTTQCVTLATFNHFKPVAMASGRIGMRVSIPVLDECLDGLCVRGSRDQVFSLKDVALSSNDLGTLFIEAVLPERTRFTKELGGTAQYPIVFMVKGVIVTDSEEFAEFFSEIHEIQALGVLV